MSSADDERRTALHRSIVIWSGLFLLTVAALISAVGILNREVYSAPAFVRIYLDALAQRDLGAVLATPGLDLGTDDEAGTGSASLISTAALSDLRDIQLVSDTEITTGRHRIVYSYLLDGANGVKVPAQSEFDVVQTGYSWLAFPQWSFQRSPTATATVTVSHAASFTAGDSQIALEDPSAFHTGGAYTVLVPSLTVLSHSSQYLGAVPVTLTATTASSSVTAIIDVQPTTTFLDAVQDAVDGFLDDCAAQPLLYPPGCPFGLDVNDRITTEPEWSIESYPVLTLIAGQDSWVVPGAEGSAHVSVEVRSLFDGTVSTRDVSMPYTVTFTVTIEPDGSIAFAPRA